MINAYISFGEKRNIYVHSKEEYDSTDWMHAVVSYDGSGDASGVTMYLDGKEIETVVGTNSLGDTEETRTIVTNAPLRIGYRNSAAPQQLLGHIDEVHIFNRALTEDQVRELYGNADLQIEGNTSCAHNCSDLDPLPSSSSAESSKESSEESSSAESSEESSEESSSAQSSAEYSEEESSEPESSAVSKSLIADW